MNTDRDTARIAWLDLMIPQLQAGGFTRLAAEYAVERDRLIARAEMSEHYADNMYT